jgi:hypothetical protein
MFRPSFSSFLYLPKIASLKDKPVFNQPLCYQIQLSYQTVVKRLQKNFKKNQEGKNSERLLAGEPVDIGALRTDQARGASVCPVEIEESCYRFIELRAGDMKFLVLTNETFEVFTISLNALRQVTDWVNTERLFFKI